MQKMGCFVLKVILNTLFQKSSLGAPLRYFQIYLVLTKLTRLVLHNLGHIEIITALQTGSSVSL